MDIVATAPAPHRRADLLERPKGSKWRHLCSDSAIKASCGYSCAGIGYLGQQVAQIRHLHAFRTVRTTYGYENATTYMV